VATDDLPTRYALRRVDGLTWVIRDDEVPASDPRHVVARITHDEQIGVGVEWLGDFPLPDRYLTVEFALDDLVRWTRRREAWSQPVPIPHMPPRQAAAR
jgi:hypothetical protein